MEASRLLTGPTGAAINSERSGDTVQIAVVGAGAMGRGIAQVSAAAGHDVLIQDVVDGAAETAVELIAEGLADSVKRGKMSPVDAHAALDRVHPLMDLSAISAAEVVIEAVIEDLAVKQELFASIEPIVSRDTVLASNTSSLSIGAIAAPMQDSSRLIGLHFFNPVPAMKLVEMVLRQETAPDVLARASDYIGSIAKTGIVVQDSPGFVVNLAGRAYVTEALALVRDNIATVDQVDRIARGVLKFPLGPFELMDLTGMDVNYPVTANLWEHNFGEGRLASTWYHRYLLESGTLGRKTGAGFYRYTEVANNNGAPEARWGSSRESKPPTIAVLDHALREILASTACSVLEVDEADLNVVAPLGLDVSTTCAELGLDPRRTVGIDTLIKNPERLTLMVPPGVDAHHVDGFRGALERAAPVEVINDSAGFIAQRLVAAVVNLGCEIAQRGIAAPADIDAAVELGLRYPRGPLSWGDELGTTRLLSVLDGVQASTWDSRYRPSAWLLRRARAGLSLLSDDYVPISARTIRPTAQ